MRYFTANAKILKIEIYREECGLEKPVEGPGAKDYAFRFNAVLFRSVELTLLFS